MSGSLPSLADVLVYVRLCLSVMVSFVRLMIHFQRSVECVSFAYMCDFIERKLPRSAAHADGNALKVFEPAVLNGVIYICASVKMAQIHFLCY